MKGLDQSRFHLFQDGHEQPIASFEENQPPANPSASEETPEAPALPENTYSNVPAYPGTGAVNVLLLDALNTPASDQEQVRKQMIKYLGTIKPGTSLAIFMLSSQLRMATGFTTDAAQLLKVLETQKGKTQTAASNLSGDIGNLAPGLANNPDPQTRWLVSTIQQFATDTQTYENDQRVMMTLTALDQLARYLAAVPGRKNLIWFSGSFPIGLTPDALSRADLKNVRDYSSAVRDTSDLLSAARVSVYPVDARGLLVSPTSSTSYLAPPGAGPKNPMAIGSDSTTNFAEQTSVEKDSMNTIATETGGHAYAMGNDLKATLNKITDNDSYYYAVSYVPPQSSPGKNGYHTIEVKVDGGKYRLGYRRGYYTAPGSNPANGSGGGPNPVSAAAQDGAPPSTQILFRARVLPDTAPELNGAALDDKAAGERTASFLSGSHRYVIDLGLKPQDMPLAENTDGKRTAQLECDLLVYDDKGQLVNSLGRELKLNLSSQQYEQLTAAGGAIPFRMALDLPTGDFRLRIVLYDAASAKTGSIEIPLEVQGKQSNP
ncbi:MAG: VWA domain-containing protein, partial [Terracidiphilus sp.]